MHSCNMILHIVDVKNWFESETIVELASKDFTAAKNVTSNGARETWWSLDQESNATFELFLFLNIEEW